MLKNTKNNYGKIARAFHWSIAILMIGMLFMGKFFGIFPLDWNVMMFHKSTGLLILFLTSLRFIWKILSVKPAYSIEIPCWMRFVASFTHFILYLGLFFMPLSGWIMSKLEYPITFYNLFTLPHLTSSADKSLRHFAHEVHEIFPNILIVLITLHIVAALYHHFKMKDNTLRKMLF